MASASRIERSLGVGPEFAFPVGDLGSGAALEAGDDAGGLGLRLQGEGQGIHRGRQEGGGGRGAVLEEQGGLRQGGLGLEPLALNGFLGDRTGGLVVVLDRFLRDLPKA